MQAFTIKTNKSDYPFLVIADGFKSAVEVTQEQMEGITKQTLEKTKRIEQVK